MSEKRFVQVGDTSIKDTLTGEKYYAPCEDGLLDLLNEQQEHITHLEDTNDNFRIKLIEDIEAMEQAEKKIGEQQATNDYLEESNSRLQIQLGETLRLVDEQQATIEQLQDLCGESDSENAKLRQEIKELKAQLREKEQDERLYANEIVKLNKEAKEVLDFKSLGGDY